MPSEAESHKENSNKPYSSLPLIGATPPRCSLLSLTI
nr:MAG TPA: hypothetical protein [Caudoviricetes sp.]